MDFLPLKSFMSKTTNKLIKNKSILMVTWQDAAFSNFKKIPKEIPPLQITFGIFLGETEKELNIGMNCHLDAKTKRFIDCKDAFLIPKAVIKEIKIIKIINV
jgi:hypothetical protein